MPLESISLRKLLKIGFSDESPRRSALRQIIRDDRPRADDTPEKGGDFYAPFWADAKAHVFGAHELHQSVTDRIADNWRRKNLYNQLRDGFLRWWGEHRRRTNEPFRPGPLQRTRFEVPDLASVVKLDSILSIEDGRGAHHYVYPYFFPRPELKEESAQLGLWLLTQAFPDVPAQDFRLLDVIRGRAFSVEQTPLRGDEEQRFLRMYAGLFQERDSLRRPSE